MSKNWFNILCITALIFLNCAIFAPQATAADSAATKNCINQCSVCESQSLKSAWPKSPIGGITLNNCSRLAELVKYLYGWGVSLGGIAVFIALVIAGFEYITSIGNPGKMKDAIDRITSAAIGLALLLGSYAIFELINPEIVTLKNTFDVVKYDDAFTSCIDASSCCDKAVTDEKGRLVIDPTTKQPKKERDPDCNFSDYVCCPAGDTKCMRTGVKTDPDKMKVGPMANGDCCCKNEACQSGFCNPTTNTCAENKSTCMRIFNEPEIGCDMVRFYKNPDMPSTAEEGVDMLTLSCVKVGESTYGGIDACPFNKPNFRLFVDKYGASWNPKSIAAFSYKRNKDGVPVDENGKAAYELKTFDAGLPGDWDQAKSYVPVAGVTPKLVPCGPGACGCEVILCSNIENGGKCAEDTARYQDKAYFKNIPDTVLYQGFMINDESKKPEIVQDYNSAKESMMNFYDLYGDY